MVKRTAAKLHMYKIDREWTNKNEDKPQENR